MFLTSGCNTYSDEKTKRIESAMKSGHTYLGPRTVISTKSGIRIEVKNEAFIDPKTFLIISEGDNLDKLILENQLSLEEDKIDEKKTERDKLGKSILDGLEKLKEVENK